MKKKLTEREMQVLNLIRDGLITKEVANVLKISVRTVETYRRNINEKLSTHNVSAALSKARQLNVIS